MWLLHSVSEMSQGHGKVVNMTRLCSVLSKPSVVLKCVPIPWVHMVQGGGDGLTSLVELEGRVLQNHRKEENHTAKCSEQPTRRAFTPLPQRTNEGKHEPAGKGKCPRPHHLACLGHCCCFRILPSLVLPGLFSLPPLPTSLHMRNERQLLDTSHC